MPDVVTRLSGPAAMASGDNTLFTVDQGHTVIVERIQIVNSTSSTKITAKVGLNASSDSNLVTPAITIPGRNMVDKSVYVIMVADQEGLQTADSLVLNASAAGLTVTVHGTDRIPSF